MIFMLYPGLVSVDFIHEIQSNVTGIPHTVIIWKNDENFTDANMRHSVRMC